MKKTDVWFLFFIIGVIMAITYLFSKQDVIFMSACTFMILAKLYKDNPEK
jgi:hypothetical protein